MQQRRSAAIEQGARPSLRVDTATARSLPAVRRRAGGARGGGDPRLLAAARPAICSLVHAVLAETDLRAGPEAVGGVARAQARLVGATPEEVDAAARAALAALAHPLLRRAAAAVIAAAKSR